MKVRDVLVPVAVAALVLVGCSSGGTERSATEAAAGPWDELPAPAAPQVPLVTPQADGQVIETVCVEVDGSGVDPEGVIDLAGASRRLEQAFALAGIEVVDRDCDATYAVTLTAERISAKYDIGGGVPITCYPAWTLNGDASMALGGQAVGTWPATDHVEPPPGITSDSCTHRDDPIPERAWEPALFAKPMADLFGDPGRFAYGFTSGDVGEVTVDDEIVAMLAYDLTQGDDPSLTVRRLDDWTGALEGRGDDASLEALVPLVPHLIAAWECAPPMPGGINEASQCAPNNPRVPAITGQIDDILHRITGEGLATQTQWWEWWEANGS